MANLVLSGDTSGTVTLSAPSVAGTTTLTLPTTSSTLATLTTPSFGTTIGVGGATASASGAGISFPATQSASSDANTLDDYEEGSWTPTDNSGAGLTFGGSTFGRYIKIGRMVYCTAFVAYPSTANTFAVGISGLPFTSTDEPDSSWGGYVTYTEYTSNPLTIIVGEPAVSVAFFYGGSTNGPTNAAMSSKQLRFTIMYASQN